MNRHSILKTLVVTISILVGVTASASAESATIDVNCQGSGLPEEGITKVLTLYTVTDEPYIKGEMEGWETIAVVDGRDVQVHAILYRKGSRAYLCSAYAGRTLPDEEAADGGGLFLRTTRVTATGNKYECPQLPKNATFNVHSSAQGTGSTYLSCHFSNIKFIR